MTSTSLRISAAALAATAGLGFGIPRRLGLCHIAQTGGLPTQLLTGFCPLDQVSRCL